MRQQTGTPTHPWQASQAGEKRRLERPHLAQPAKLTCQISRAALIRAATSPTAAPLDRAVPRCSLRRGDTARDVRTFLDELRVTCQCCAQERDVKRLRCCTTGQCCDKQLSPLTVTYVHAVLKPALEHAVREDELPRNGAQNV